MNQIQFKTNINCGGCIKSVTPFLNALDDIDAWQVNTEVAEKNSNRGNRGQSQ